MITRSNVGIVYTVFWSLLVLFRCELILLLKLGLGSEGLKDHSQLDLVSPPKKVFYCNSIVIF